MKGALVVYRRELAGLFVTPLGWALLFLALLLNGIFFSAYLLAYDGNVNDGLAGALGYGTLYWALMALLPPLLTMRMISEEARSGMLEFLLTAPVGDTAVIVGKLLAATTFMALLWSSALVYAVALAWLGAPPDWGQLGAGMLGSVLASGLFCAAGLVASALTSTPILAAFLAFLFNVALLAAPLILPQIAGPYRDAVRVATERIDVLGSLQGSFLVGVFDTASVVFFLAWTAVLVVLAARLLEVRRWW